MKRLVRVKICGLTRREDVEAAVEAGADALGVIVGFGSSPRNRSLEEAARLFEQLPPFVCRVLVTTSRVLRENGNAVKRIAPGAIQLYGSTVGLMDFGIPLILPYAVGQESKLPDWKVLAEYEAVITDTYDPRMNGGTGRVSDWSLCRRIREEIAPVPMILSGGLTPSNVREAVRAVRPYAVDVSSGVEFQPGLKDRTKMIEFVEAAKGAE